MRSALLVVVLVGSVAAAPLPPVTDDAKLVQGSWTVVSLSKGGTNAPEDEVKKMTFVIKDDTLTVNDGRRNETGAIKLAAGKKPKTMDLVMKKGDRSETVPFIYELDGDSLKLCWNEAEKGRPTAFDATKATGLMVLKRKK